jgi:hypothetical protein
MVGPSQLADGLTMSRWNNQHSRGCDPKYTRPEICARAQNDRALRWSPGWDRPCPSAGGLTGRRVVPSVLAKSCRTRYSG